MRAGLYARVSTTEQAEEGYSIEAQLEAMRRHCEAKGWSVVAEYIDDGISGTTVNRPALQAALADCEARRVDFLLTHKLDRLFRNLKEMLNAVDELKSWGVTYVSVVENIDRSMPHGNLLFHQLGSIAQYFSDNLSREVSKGKRGRAKSGKSNASIPPPGYKRVEGQEVYMVKEDEAETIRRAFELYATGSYSLLRVAKLLNQEGRSAGEQSVGGKWSRTGVGIVLGNPFYAGLVLYTDTETGRVTIFPGKHEPIITQELWERVQEIRKRRETNRVRTPTKRVYLLQSLLVCCHCGRRLYSEANRAKKRDYLYYRDPTGRKGWADCPVAHVSVPVEVFDGQVADLVKRLVLPDDWRERLDELAEDREERETLEGKRNYLKGKLRRLRELYVEGDFSKTEYNRRRAELRGQLDALTVPEQPAIEAAGETLEELGEVWADAPKRLQHEMLKTIFEAIYVDLQTKRLVCVKPYPQFAPLFRIDGLREKEGCFYVGEEDEEVGPKD